MRYTNVNPPRVQDVGVVLHRHAGRFPPWFAAEVGTLARVSRQLRGERERSMYGDEDTGLPPREIYTQADGQQTLQDPQLVVDLCARLVRAGF